MAVEGETVLRTSLRRPVVSEDGSLIGIVTPEHCLSVFRPEQDGSLHEIICFRFPKSLDQFAANVSHVRWSSSDAGDSLPLLLLSDGLRLVVVDPMEMSSSASMKPGRRESPPCVVADYQLGDQFGKLTYADFFLDSQHAMVLFEMSSQAAVLSLSKPQRDDVPDIKFKNVRSVSRSPDGRSAALLLRTRGQDQIMVLGLKDGALEGQATFNSHTNDAQRVMWSPNADPVLAVCESAAYGVKISFFSALGHQLTQLDVSQIGGGSGLSGLGISNMSWATIHDGTMLAVADGEKRVFVRRQNNRKMAVQTPTILAHGDVIDGSKSIVWQQTGTKDIPFTLQRGAFDAVTDTKSGGGDINILHFNSDCTFLATVTADNNKALWLWQPEHPDPHSVILFQDAVQQVLWHPKRADILVILTAQKLPVIYLWHSEAKAPVPCVIPLHSPGSTKYQASWLGRSIQGRHPFMLTTTTAFELGMLEEGDGAVRFSRLVNTSMDYPLEDDGDEDLTEELSTPSKPSRYGAGRGNLGVLPGATASQFGSASTSRW